MCEFISWIETKDKEGNQILCYLTDQDVYSSYGQQTLKDCQDNDLIGHGAIRKFFDLTNGHDKEQTDFWETKTIPKEITEKINNFDQHWGKMFKSGIFQNGDLRYIIRYAPDPWKEKAWQQLLKQKPTNGDLCYIIRYTPDPWKEKAWQQLLKQKPTNGDLCYIIEYAPDPWREKAWQQLLKQKPTNGDLHYIIVYAPDPWRKKAKKLLSNKQASRTSDTQCRYSAI